MTPVHPWLRLGYIIPHLYTDVDAYQFYRVAPEGVMLITTGLDLTEYTIEAVERELPVLRARLDLLAARKPDRIALSGVPVAAALGRERVRALLAEGEARTRIPFDTDLEAHIAALHHLGARRIALATRWPEAVNSALARYLADAGIEVLACASRARTLAQNKQADAAADHALALELGEEALSRAPQAQALLLPGGLWHAIHAAPMLEARHGKPVLLNIASTLWAALRAAPALHHRPDPRWGKLLAAL